MKIERKHVVFGILGVLVILMISGILITQIPRINNVSLSNQSIANPPESKGPSNIAFPSNFNSMVQLPSTTSSMPIYQKTTKNRSETDVRDLAAKFGVTGELSVESVSSSRGTITYVIYPFTADNKDFMVWISGNEKDQDPKLLPTDSEAGTIADNFIKSHGYYPGANRQSIVHSPATSCDTQTNNCRVESEFIDVTYDHIFEGYEFLPDFMYVDVGENGNVIRFVSRWNSYEKVKNVTIISPSEAIQVLQKQGIPLTTSDVTSGKATITTLNLVYDYADPHVWTDTVVPFYYFKGEIQGTNGVIGWDQYVPAMKTP
jgi:hypothetical protein